MTTSDTFVYTFTSAELHELIELLHPLLQEHWGSVIKLPDFTDRNDLATEDIVKKLTRGIPVENLVPLLHPEHSRETGTPPYSATTELLARFVLMHEHRLDLKARMLVPLATCVLIEQLKWFQEQHHTIISTFHAFSRQGTETKS